MERLGCFAGALLLVACGSNRTELSVSAGASSQAIIGGFEAASAYWDHTGALAFAVEDIDEVFPFCTATLIGGETVVTAKHCVDFVLDSPEFAPSLSLSFYWAAGGDVSDPVERIPIASMLRAPLDEGGFVQLGHDVGVMHLSSPSSTEPATAQLFSEELVGRPMVSLGYGVFSPDGESDTKRRIGRETIAASEGRAYEVMFGDFESFVEWHVTSSVSDQDILERLDPESPLLVEATELFEDTVLLTGHEAVTGLAARDTQSCFGDSGGPLGRLVSGEFQTFGVVSGGVDSAQQVCDFGTVFATFGPEVIGFVEHELRWRDPCGNETAEGRCDGDVRVACETQLLEGSREIVVEDCEQAGQACVETASGASCQVRQSVGSGSLSGERLREAGPELETVTEARRRQELEALLGRVREGFL